jgi:protease I
VRQPIRHHTILTFHAAWRKTAPYNWRVTASGLIKDKRIALLIEEGFAARHVLDVRRRLVEAGATVVVVGPTTRSPFLDKTGQESVTADQTAAVSHARDFDAVVIPGGQAPDRIRMRHAMLDLVTGTLAAGKPVAAICHGPQVLISAQALRGRTVTCWPSIAIDVKNAGGLYVDRPAVRDGNLITARKGDDIPQFVDVLISALT